MAKDDVEDLDVAGRLADGWAYAVTLKSGTTRRYHATFPMSRISLSGVIVFDGAHVDLEGPREGAGIVRADEVAGINYWGPYMDAIVAIENGAEMLADEGGEGDEFKPAPPTGGKSALRAMAGGDPG